MADIQIWTIHVEEHATNIDRWRTSLTADERKKADRYAFDKDRNAFTLGRGLLRRLVGERIACLPQDVPIQYNGYGKPSVKCEGPHFNVSHSGGLVVVAICDQYEIGVDIELCRKVEHLEELAQRFFSEEETEKLHSAYAQPIDGFFECWTRKEAYIKGRGLGLSIELDTFDVPLSVADRESWQEIASRESNEEWFVRAFSAPETHAAAIAAPVSGLTIEQFACSPHDH